MCSNEQGHAVYGQGTREGGGGTRGGEGGAGFGAELLEALHTVVQSGSAHGKRDECTGAKLRGLRSSRSVHGDGRRGAPDVDVGDVGCLPLAGACGGLRGCRERCGRRMLRSRACSSGRGRHARQEGVRRGGEPERPICPCNKLRGALLFPREMNLSIPFGERSSTVETRTLNQGKHYGNALSCAFLRSNLFCVRFAQGANEISARLHAVANSLISWHPPPVTSFPTPMRVR